MASVLLKLGKRALEPTYQLLDEKEIDRLGLPKETREYYQSKKKVYLDFYPMAALSSNQVF